MERGFLSQKEGEGGRGVKEKQQGSTNITTPVTSDSAYDTIKDIVMVSLDGVGSYLTLSKAYKNSPASANEVDKNASLRLFPTPSMSNSYANVTGNPSRKRFDFYTLFTPGVKLYGVPVTAFSEDGLSVIATKLVTLVNDEGHPVKEVDYLVDHDSEDEVASIDKDMARSMALESIGFGTNSLLEQWGDSYKNVDYDYDSYDDDMYER
uniref:Uncharacterized protein n=1 Tax=Tanacetum cinerariifolium TaxID=118510 RepID=A0A6L2JBC2_TANCI|nr:hypothetical protein [Tanacetum cinerariifolium]